MGRKDQDRHKSVIPVYSREDIREQYCINDKELAVLDNKRKKGLLGCFSDNGHAAGLSPCTKHGKKSLLTSCISKTGSDEDLAMVKRPFSPGRNGTTWTGNNGRHAAKDEEDGFDENYFRRRPKSFYFDSRRPVCPDPGVRMSHVNIADENYYRTMGYQRPCPGPVHPMMQYQHQQALYTQTVLTRPEMFLSQDTLPSITSQLTTQPNTPDLLLHRKAVRKLSILSQSKSKSKVEICVNLESRTPFSVFAISTYSKSNSQFYSGL